MYSGVDSAVCAGRKEGGLFDLCFKRVSDTVKFFNFVSIPFEGDMCAICMPG